jgi:hypothetical protein
LITGWNLLEKSNSEKILTLFRLVRLFQDLRRRASLSKVIHLLLISSNVEIVVHVLLTKIFGGIQWLKQYIITVLLHLGIN